MKYQLLISRHQRAAFVVAERTTAGPRAPISPFIVIASLYGRYHERVAMRRELKLKSLPTVSADNDNEARRRC